MHYSDLELHTFLWFIPSVFIDYKVFALQVSRARHECVTSSLTSSTRNVANNNLPRSPSRRGSAQPPRSHGYVSPVASLNDFLGWFMGRIPLARTNTVEP